jgi:hypothetical protein
LIDVGRIGAAGAGDAAAVQPAAVAVLRAPVAAGAALCRVAWGEVVARGMAVLLRRSCGAGGVRAKGAVALGMDPYMGLIRYDLGQ